MPRNLSQDFLSNIQGHWNFDDDLTDQSGNGFTLTHSGTARYGTVDSLRTIWLDGDTLTRANEALLEITGVLTLHVLVYATTSNAALTLLSFAGAGETAPDNTLYQLAVTSSLLEYFAEEGAGTDIGPHSFDMALPRKGWHLVTMTRDSGGEVTLYIDGELAGVASTTLNVPADGTSATLTLGSANLRGYLGGCMVASSEATASEVWLQYEHVFESAVQYRDMNPNLLPGVVAHWDFNDTLTDNINSLTLGLGAGAVERYMSIQGKRCFAAVQGSGATTPYLLQAAHTSVLSITGTLTVHCLYFGGQQDVSASDILLFNYLSSGESQETNQLYSLQLNSVQEVRYFAEQGAGSNIDYTFETGAPFRGWHLWTLVRDGSGDVSLYLDGQPAGQPSSGLSAPTTSGVQTQVLQLMQESYQSMVGGLMVSTHQSTDDEVEAMWRWITRGGPKQRRQAGGSKSTYLMRATHTTDGEVTWVSTGQPDPTGSASPFVPGDLSDIRLVKELVL